MFQFIFTFMSLFLFNMAWAKVEICPEVIVHGDDDIELSDTERRMVCGDPKLDAYREIPAYQAQYFFRGFLQSRGYLNPEFNIEDKLLHVHVGKKAHLKKIIVNAEEGKKEDKVKEEIKRFFKGKLVTPKLLDGIEADSVEVLRRRGFPCAETQSEMDVAERTVRLNLTKLESHNFGKVEKEEIEGLASTAFARFYPFDPDDLFDERLLRLTEKRMLRAEVVQGTYFLESCTEEGSEFSLSQYFILGPPRTIRFGAGVSTEVGPMARIRWSHNRYGSMASSLTANLQASFRSQSLNLTADMFFWEDSPRRSLLSQFEIIRESQIDYEELVVKLKPHMKWTDDFWSRHWTWVLGPTLQSGTYLTKENDDTKTFSTGSIEGGVQWMSHEYEFYDIHPEEGDVFGFNFDFRDPRFGFSEPLLLLDTTFSKLGKLANWGRGSAVGGIRIDASTTFVPDDVSLQSLPPSVKFYGGGSDDIRGFLLRTLPDNDGLGALTKLALKLELRKTHLFKDYLEGFIFADNAYFGKKSWSIESRLWYSPGVGVRWLSPIGLVQAYVARGFATRPHEDYGHFYYAGLGGTF